MFALRRRTPAAAPPRGSLSFTLSMPDPLDADAMWDPPSRFRVGDGVRDANGDPRRRLREFIAANRLPPLPGAGNRPRPLGHFILELPAEVYHHDRLFTGSERSFVLLQALGEHYARDVADGSGGRWVLAPHDGPADQVTVRTGPNLFVPVAGETPEGVMSVVWTATGGRPSLLSLPAFACLRASGDLVETVIQPVGVYQAQRRLVIGWSPEHAPWFLEGGPGPAGERILVDLHAARAAWATGGPHQIERAMEGGTVMIRLEPAPAVHAARPGVPRPGAPRPGAPRTGAPRTGAPRTGGTTPRPPGDACAPARETLRSGTGGRDGAPADQPPDPSPARSHGGQTICRPRRDPCLDTPAPPRPAAAPAKATLVRPAMARPPAVGTEGTTVVLANARRAAAADPAGLGIAVTEFLLARVDESCQCPGLRGWEIAVGPDGLPLPTGAPRGAAMGISATADWPHLLWRRPDDARWRPYRWRDAPGVLPSWQGLVLVPPPEAIADRYHGRLRLPVPWPLPFSQGRRHHFGRAVTARPPAEPTLTFGLLAIDGSLGLEGNPNATLEDVNLSRDHGVLYAEGQQLHIALTNGRTPVWKLGPDGEVDGVLEPGSTDELVLTIGESFVVGGYVIEVREP